MIVLVALGGLVIGNLLNLVIARQIAEEGSPAPPRREGLASWLPVVGTVRDRSWVALAVELVTMAMAAILFRRHGLIPHSLLTFGAALVLIDTGAVDFEIRMIDPLVLVVAMLAALLLAPINEIVRRYLIALLGLVAAGGVFILFFLLAKLLYPGVAAPFGLGDVYLAAFIGALVGFYHLPTALFYGMALAGLVALALIILRALGHSVPQYIAYGTYLCVGALFFLATGNY